MIFRRLVPVAALVVAVAACSTPEYKTDAAVRDMERLGLTRTEAQCVVKRLRQRYAHEYLVAQRREVERRHLKPSDVAVNQQAVDLYVRNKLAGQDTIGNDEKTAARAVAARCGTSR